MKLSVIIPSYNEERTLAKVIDAVKEVDLAGPLGVEISREVIVIDDGSTDGTERILAAYESHPDVRIIRHGDNRGKGAAIRSGFAVARGDVVIIQDADMEYDPRELPRLL